MRPAAVLESFFGAAIAFAGAAAVALLAGERWLGLHLLFVGGISQLVLGAAQYFAGAFLATEQAGARLVGALLAVWAAGTLAVAVGVQRDAQTLTGAGAALLLGGLALWARALRAMERRSLTRAAWALRWYYACAAFLAAGAVLGSALAAGRAPAGGDAVAAHVLLNAGGWFGTAIVGTLHTFWPSLTGTALAHERLQGPAFRAWTAGVALAAAGALAGVAALAALGWAALLAAAALLLVNVWASLRARTVLTPFGALVGLGQPLLVLGLLAGLAGILATGDAAPSGAWRTTASWLLLAGWVGCTVAGSLAHLLGVLAGIRRARVPGR